MPVLRKEGGPELRKRYEQKQRATIGLVDTRGQNEVCLCIIQVVTLAATNALDIQSSWGKREMNGTLAGSTGRFDGRSALLKLGVVGGVWTLEYLVLRRQPALYRKLAFVNFGDSSVTGALAIRNYGVPLH